MADTNEIEALCFDTPLGVEYVNELVMLLEGKSRHYLSSMEIS